MFGGRFQILGWLTIGAVYFLILVGGVVRASGSGMGCPDWPKCFDRWIPPTVESQLPPDYQQIYAEHGYGETRFNAFKTWTEYINRLIGVVIGFLIFLVVLASLRYWSRDRAIVGCSVVALVLVAFQGWLGSVVVDSNLAPWMVTVHMMVALLLVGLLIYTLTRAQWGGVQSRAVELGSIRREPRLTVLLLGCIGLTGLQVVLGTQVREGVDRVASSLAERSEWVGELGALLLVHRSFSLVLLVANLWLLYCLRRRQGYWPLRRLGVWLLVTLLAEILAGTVLFYWALPTVVQPLHLLFATLLAGIQLRMLMVYWAFDRSDALATS